MDNEQKEQLKYIFVICIWPAIIGSIVFSAVGMVAYFFDKNEFLW